MKINPDIFRAYDIRGIYPEDLNEEVAYIIGRAYVQFLGKKNPKIVVGQDNRLSSPQIFNALTKGMVDQGADVINIGLSSSPLLYFSVANYGFDGGINVTASHNPLKYNGFKIVKENSFPVSGDNGIYEIRDLVLRNEFQDQEKGKITTKDVFPDYKKANVNGFDLGKIKPMKIVIDTANAVSGLAVPEFLKETKCQVDYLFLELDGNFPNHNPDPLIKENIAAICQKVKKDGADLGIALDGDGDRIIFIDEKGEAIDGDLITALISKAILKDSPGENIVYDVRSSNIVPETIKENKGNPKVGKIGHTLFKEKMRKENAVFGGELSGHYYHRDHFFCECPFFVLFKTLEIISQANKPFSEIISPFKKYFNSGEINFKVQDKEKILKELEKNPLGSGEEGKILKLDGLRIDFKDWWFLVRPSNTEPLLRLVIEAKSKKLVEEKTHLLSNFLNG